MIGNHHCLLHSYQLLKHVCRRETFPLHGSRPLSDPLDHEDGLPIRLRIFTITGTRCFSDGPVTHSPRTFMTDKHFSILFTRVKQLSNRSWYEALMGRFLSEMGVPEDEQPAISLKIFEVIDVAVPERPIDVMIDDVTVLLLDSAEDHYMAVDRVTRESMEAYRAKLIPATKSAIEGLEKVVATVGHGFESCAICIESLEEDKEKMVTRLPCSHYYHGDCIVQWLKINHVCPLCRYPMTIREATSSQNKS